MMIENISFVANSQAATSNKRESLSLDDLVKKESAAADDADDFEQMPMLKVIPLDDESSSTSGCDCHHYNGSLVNPDASTSLCASINCVIEQLHRSTMMPVNASITSTDSSTSTQKRQRPSSHRRERNQAFTARDFDAVVLSQLDMTV